MPLTQIVKNSKFLTSLFKPLASIYPNIAGYRRYGLRYDDLIAEENDVVKEALRRLPSKEAADRAYRLKLAFNLSVSKSELPESQWTKPSEDKPYLLPIIEEVEREFKEREQFDTLKGR